MMFYIECLTFLLVFSHPGRSDNTEILETYEYPGGIYWENRTALMTLIYKKPTSFNIQWTAHKTGLGYSESFLLEEEITLTYRSQIDGRINDTVAIKTQRHRSGTFLIIDPIINKTVRAANFTLRFLVAPRETNSNGRSWVSKKSSIDQIYNFECSTAAYPLPEIHLEINSCSEELARLCEDVWKPLISVNEIRSVKSTYYRKQKIGVRADQIGAVRCVANNMEGEDEKQFIVIPSDIVDTEINSGMSISPQTWDKTVVFRGDEFNLTCQVQKYEFKRFLVCSKKEPGGNEIVLARQSGGLVLFRSKLGERHQLHFDGTSSNFSNKFVLQFINVSKAEAGFYRCKTTDLNGKDFIRTVNVTIDDDFKPIINDSTLAPEDIVFSNDSSVTLPCKVHAQPPADVVWYKNGEILNMSLNGNIKKTAEWLQFIRAFQTDEGLYVCVATNRVGRSQRSYQLRYQSVFAKNIVPITMAIIGGVILLIFTAILIQLAILNSRRNQDLWKFQKELEENEANEFDPILPIFDQMESGHIAMRLRYPFGLNVNELVLLGKNGQQLGSGCFGVIMKMPKGKWLAIRPGYPVCLIEDKLVILGKNGKQSDYGRFNVAIKQMHITEGKEKYHFCLADADKLLKNVPLLGCGQFGVVLQVGLKMALKLPKWNWDVEQYRMLHREICLMTYLGRHPNIVNMIGCVKNIANGQLYMLMELCEGGSLLNFLHSLRKPEKFCSELHHVEEYQNVSSNTDCYVRELSDHWPIIKAKLNGYRFHSDLIGYAYQIACGMEYLSSINFVHRDLAARNVLLSNNFEIAKIADFGLSLKISENQNDFRERKEEKLVLPVRSTAPEAFINYTFSAASDVWSFGILIGEIFSFGDIPFAHINCDIDAYKLQRGEILLQKPKYATDTIFQLMTTCCQPEEKNRITFTEAKLKLTMELNRCGHEHLEQLQVKLNELQSTMDTAVCEPTNNSIFDPYQPKSQPNLCTSQSRFTSLLNNIPKMRVKNFFTVNSTDNGHYANDQAILRRLTSENSHKGTITCEDAERTKIRIRKSSSRTSPVYV